MYNLTKDEIEVGIGGYFNKESVLKNFEDAVPKHYTWIAEDGTPCSCWKIGNLLTGDGGKELYDKALKDLFYK